MMVGMKIHLLSMFKKAAKLVLFGPTNLFNFTCNFVQLNAYGVKHGHHIKINGRIHIHGNSYSRKKTWH